MAPGGAQRCSPRVPAQAGVRDVKSLPRRPRCSAAPAQGLRRVTCQQSTRPAVSSPVPVWDARAAGTKGGFHWLTPRRDHRGEFLRCFYGLQPMHGESGAPSDLLPLKALHSQAGWKEVKEKAVHVFKCRGGLDLSPKSSPPGRLRVRAHRLAGIWASD